MAGPTILKKVWTFRIRDVGNGPTFATLDDLLDWVTDVANEQDPEDVIEIRAVEMDAERFASLPEWEGY